jgi:hypothetical protein
MKWFTNLAALMKHLVFEYQTQHIWAQHQNVNTKITFWVIRDVFVGVVGTVK